MDEYTGTIMYMQRLQGRLTSEGELVTIVQMDTAREVINEAQRYLTDGLDLVLRIDLLLAGLGALVLRLQRLAADARKNAE